MKWSRIILVVALAIAKTGRADAPLEPIPPAQPVIAIDDTHTHGPTARDYVDLTIDTAWIHAPSNALALTTQGAFGLWNLSRRELREVLGPFQNYELRIRENAFADTDGFRFGPLTVGLQRYFPVNQVAIAPLAFAHAGVEFAVSTPWLSDRFAPPPLSVRIVDGVDTELARNGWSLRPASSYLRLDFLACRSVYVEVGGGPEAFIPTTGATEFDVRYHAAGGVSFGCGQGVSHDLPKVQLEYRGRLRLHAGDAAFAVRDSLGVALQLDLARFAIQVFATTDPGWTHIDEQLIGLRLTIGKAK